MDELKKYLLDLGVSKVGYADVEGLANEFVDLPNGISLVLKIPKETIQLVIDEDYPDYWKSFHKQIAILKCSPRLTQRKAFSQASTKHKEKQQKKCDNDN